MIWAGLIIGGISGLLMFAKPEALATLTHVVYTGLELGLVASLFAAALSAVVRQSDQATKTQGA